MADRVSDHAVAYERNVADVINELDTMLKTLRSMHEQLQAGTSWKVLLASHFDNNSVAAQFAVIDSDGWLIASTSPLPPERVDLSYREHFRVHVGATADNLFVSQPIIGRVSQQRTIQLTRRLLKSNGSFGGVIVATVTPERLTGSYRDIGLGRNGGVALIGDDGVVRTGTGAFAAASDLSATLLEKANPVISAANAAGRVQPVYDDGLLLIASRRVGLLPLVVVAALDNDVGKAPWDTAFRNLVALALLCTVMLALAFMIALRLQFLAIASIKQRNAMAVGKRVAEAAAAQRTLFLAVMSHEIRTPLNGVLGALDLVRSEPLSALGRKHVNMATECGEMLLKVIGDILLFSKLEHDAIEFEAAPLVLRDLLVATVEAMQPLADKAGNSLKAIVADKAGEPVLGDCNRLRQVLVNLIGNAIKFTQNGRIEVSLDAIACDADAMTYRISVSDTGIGIPADKQKLIFEKFHTLEANYTRRTDGTGLGLAISDKIVRAMGSRIDLDSAVGCGSCFSFVISFPRVARPQRLHVVSQSPAPSPSDARKLHILLAEDNPTNAYVVKQILAEAGHDVRHATTGREAVAQADTERFDLILMDISMPEMDGIEAARLIKQRALNGETRIIALTAHVVDGSGNEFARGQFDDFLSKPIRKSALLNSLHFPGTSGTLPGSSSAPTAEQPLALPHNGSTTIDIGIFASFVSDRSSSRLLKTLAIFVEELRDKRCQLDGLMRESDRQKLRLLAHSCVGSAAMVGATRLVNISREVELLCAQAATVDKRMLLDMREAMELTINVFAPMNSDEAVQAFLSRSAAA